MASHNYYQMRKTQIAACIDAPLFIRSGDKDFVLYKQRGEAIDQERYFRDGFPELYIQTADKVHAIRELQRTLERTLVKKIRAGAIVEVKQVLCDIVRETFREPMDTSIVSLPDTIDIVYEGYFGSAELLKDFADFQYGGDLLVDHSVNVMALALSFCLYHGVDEAETKRICLGALLHDVGITRLPKPVVTYRGRLPDRLYREFTNHPAIGHDIVKTHEKIDSSIALAILEHHERLDGSGYPRGIAHISFEGRLLGLIDSFDSLTSTEKIHRKKRRPFDAMMVIRDEVIHKGLFDRTIFHDLCLSLGNPSP